MSQRGPYKTSTPKTYAERYRWKPEEKLEILDELQHDVTIMPKATPAYVALADVADSEDRFNKMGHYTTGFPTLDQLCLGFDPGEYVVLGAPTNGGKTQLATYIAKTQAAAGVPTLYISRELNNIEIKKRFKFIGSGTNNLSVPEAGRLSPQDLISLIRSFAATHDQAFVVVDHLHAFCRGANLTEQLGELSAALRELAQELAITILALSQFNREKFTNDEGPSNYHLKESGYLADDAYTILLGWRTDDGLNLKLSKTRRLDLGDLLTPIVILKAGRGRLIDPTANYQAAML